jgi:hypothetical protein
MLMVLPAWIRNPFTPAAGTFLASAQLSPRLLKGSVSERKIARLVQSRFLHEES